VESKKHEEQIRHNTVVMMEMQDTINELQRELGNLGRSASHIRQSSDLTTPQVGRTLNTPETCLYRTLNTHETCLYRTSNVVHCKF
jgi:hypothetical protein